jgi:hypothetical protein
MEVLEEGKSPAPAGIRTPDPPFSDLVTVLIVHMDYAF